MATDSGSAAGDVALRAAPAGLNANGIPYYIVRSWSAEDRELLRSAYGVTDPARLYLSDSSRDAIVKYDAQAKRCRGCYVDSYRVGFLSTRRAGETWDDFLRRARCLSRRDFRPAARAMDTSLDDLDPDAQPAFRELLDAGRRAGFRLTVLETYRMPDREALLFAEGPGRTYTTTSMHSYGRAVDIAVGDGNATHAATRAEWVRFRRFIVSRPANRFRLIGSVDHTWDWAHVELPSPTLGFHSVDEALRFAKACTTDSARTHPPSPAVLGGAASDPCVFVPHLPHRAP